MPGFEMTLVGVGIGAPSEFKLIGSAFGNPRLAIAAIHSARCVAHAPTIFAGQPGPVWSQLPRVNPFVALVSTFPFNVYPIVFFLYAGFFIVVLEFGI